MPLPDRLPAATTNQGRYLRRAILAAHLADIRTEHARVCRQILKAIGWFGVSSLSLLGVGFAFWQTVIGIALGYEVFHQIWVWGVAVPSAASVLGVGHAVFRVIDKNQERRQLASDIRFCRRELERL